MLFLLLLLLLCCCRVAADAATDAVAATAIAAAAAASFCRLADASCAATAAYAVVFVDAALAPPLPAPRPCRTSRWVLYHITRGGSDRIDAVQSAGLLSMMPDMLLHENHHVRTELVADSLSGHIFFTFI